MSPKGRAKGSRNKNSSKTIFERSGFKVIKMPEYVQAQVPQAIKTRSFLTDVQGKGKVTIEYRALVGDFFRSETTNEYLLFVRENESGKGLMVRTGLFVQEFSITEEILLEWEEAFYEKMKKDEDFEKIVDYSTE